MTNSKKIKLAIAYKGISEAKLARAIGTSPQNFNQRLKTDKFSTAELEKIAEVLGATYVSEFQFPEGTKI